MIMLGYILESGKKAYEGVRGIFRRKADPAATSESEGQGTLSTAADTPPPISPADLLEFIPDNIGGRLWNGYDHTAETGVEVGGDPAVFAAPDGSPHIYMRGMANNLLEFIPDNIGGRLWNGYDHTAETGVEVGGDPAVFAAPDGSPHIYMRGMGNNLLEFIPDNIGGRLWNGYDHTAETGVEVGGDPAVFAAPDGSPHIYMRGMGNNLLEFIPDNIGGRLWNGYDHTAETGVEVGGDPAVFAAPDGSPHIYMRGMANNLLEFIPDNIGGRLWNGYDHTAETGVEVGGDPAVFAAPDGSPHIYMRGPVSTSAVY